MRKALATGVLAITAGCAGSDSSSGNTTETDSNNPGTGGSSSTSTTTDSTTTSFTTTTSTTSTTSTDTTTSTETGGTGGGTTTEMECSPGDIQSCYQGPDGTLGVGPCAAGTQTCKSDGTWGGCSGQVVPMAELCDNDIDEDCNGDVDDVYDEDGDGWTTCDGDCCDVPGTDCSDPELVNPGAYEFAGNGVDDDCDSDTEDDYDPSCSSSSDFSDVTATDVAKAMDLCQFVSSSSDKWGVISADQLLSSGSTPSSTQLTYIQDRQTAIMTGFGSNVDPQRGSTMAAISSGYARDEGDSGYPGDQDSNFSVKSSPPSSYTSQHGNKLPASEGCNGTCSAGSGAYDPVNIKLQIRVPTNALSFSYQFKFYTYEYWIYSCTSYNDFYLALLDSNADGIPSDGNISFDSLGNPVSVNNGFFDECKAKGCYTCPDGTSNLQGTGFETSNYGGATNWLTTEAPVVPGETITLQLMVFDVSDANLDSLVLLDNFQWDLEASEVGTHE